jgi:3,4-dihydroxy 2-butanone 4-phosphate synthase/GTP cyclohydrolase II
MARLPDLIPFAKKHGLKIGTIRDLIAYRMRHDHLVAKVAEVEIESEHGGKWTAMTYANTAEYAEHLVLQKGRIDPAKPTLVRVHVVNAFADLFHEAGGRSGLIGKAMDCIAAEGSGVLILIRDSRADGLSQQMKARGLGEFNTVRELGVGSQILVDLGVDEMELLTTGHRAYVGLEGYGLKVVSERPLID